MHGCPPKHVEMGKFAPALGSTDNTSVCSNALLSTGDDWWRPQMLGDAVRRNDVTVNMKIRNSKFARFMQ